MTFEEAFDQAKTFTESDPGEAINQWQTLTERFPHREEGILGKAACRRVLNEEREAIQIYEDLLKTHPKSLGALAGLGDIYLDNRNWEKVEEIYGLIASTFENVPWAFVHESSACSHLGKPEQALAVLDRGLKTSVDRGLLQDQRVQILCAMDNGEDALATLKEITVEGSLPPTRQEELARHIARIFLDRPGYPKTAFDLDDVLLAFFRYDPTRRRK